MKTKEINVSIANGKIISIDPVDDIDHEAYVLETHSKLWDTDRIFGGALVALSVITAAIIVTMMPEEGITAPIITGILGAAGLFHK